MIIFRASCLVAAVFAFASLPKVGMRGQGTAQRAAVSPTLGTPLIGRMSQVTMLEYRIDRPLREIRMLVNGKIVDPTLNIAPADAQTSLKMTAVVSERNESASVYVDTINFSTEFTAMYPKVIDARDGYPRDSFGLQKDIRLPESGWVEVYRLSAERFRGADVIHWELKVEIR